MSRLVELQVIEDSQNGSLGIAECGSQVPFFVRRAFYLFDLPAGAIRGRHAHRELEQFVICLSGAIEISVEDASGKTDITLQSATRGLYVPAMNWLVLNALKDDTVCLVLASALYDESDYVRDYDEFQRLLSTQSDAR